MAVRALFSTVALALIAGPALASGVIHSANTEMGYTSHRGLLVFSAISDGTQS